MNLNQTINCQQFQKNNNDFADHWAFYEKVIQEHGYENYHTQRPTSLRFKTGRQKHIFTFRSKNGKMHEHYAMELISKRTGLPYYVVNRRPFK
jgi:hypothetical protein